MFKLALAVILLAAVASLSRLGVFKVKNIDCRLNHYPCPMSLEPVLLNFIGQNIFSFSRAAAIRQFNTFDPTLTEIKVSKSLPDRLNIDLIRRLPLARIKTGDNSGGFYLDKTGFVYAQTLAGQPLPEVWWPQELELGEGESPLSRELARLINTLSAYYVSWESLTRLPEAVYLIKTTAGAEALLPAEADFAGRVGSLQFILTNIKMGEALPTKIDLRFDKPILTY